MPFDRENSQQPVSASTTPQHPADDTINDGATASRNGNVEPIRQPSAETAERHASTSPHPENCNEHDAVAVSPHETAHPSSAEESETPADEPSDGEPFFTDEVAFLRHVGTKMDLWRGFLYKKFPGLHADLYAFVDDVICRTIQRCTNPENLSHYSNFDPNIASFNTWFCWQLIGAARDVWKDHYKRKRTWEARHDANVRTLDDFGLQDDDDWHDGLETSGYVVPSHTPVPLWESRLDLTGKLDELFQRLTSAERSVFQVMLDGYVEYKDIAELTGYKEGHVGVLFSRIREKSVELGNSNASSINEYALEVQNNCENIVRKERALPYKYYIGAKQSSSLHTKLQDAGVFKHFKVSVGNIYVVELPGFAERWNCYRDDERHDGFYDFNPEYSRPYKGKPQKKPHRKAGIPDLAADPISSAVGPMVEFPYEKLFGSKR